MDWFSCVFGEFRCFVIWCLQLWILAKIGWFIQENSNDFCQHRSIYIGKVKGFLSTSVDLYRKSQKILTDINRFKHEKRKGFNIHWWIYNYTGFVKIFAGPAHFDFYQIKQTTLGRKVGRYMKESKKSVIFSRNGHIWKGCFQWENF